MGMSRRRGVVFADGQPALHQLLALACGLFDDACPQIRWRHEPRNAGQLVHECLFGLQHFAAALALLNMLEQLSAVGGIELAIDMTFEQLLIVSVLAAPRRDCLRARRLILVRWLGIWLDH